MQVPNAKTSALALPMRVFVMIAVDWLYEAEKVWNGMERTRGTYHPHDRDAYINAFWSALESAHARGRESVFKELIDRYCGDEYVCVVIEWAEEQITASR